MAEVGETSSAPEGSATERPLVVRVKRKPSQSPVEALWLEISERPLKRALLDFEKLSLSGPSGKEQSRTRRVFVKHVETVSSSEETIDVLQSFVEIGCDNGSRSRASSGRRYSFRKEDKQGQLLSKAKQEQEALAKSARFEQIWKSRRGNKEAGHDEVLDQVCRLYDVIRVDSERTSGKASKQERMSKEDQESLCKFLPMLRDLVPDAAEDIESDMNSYVGEQEEFVFDLYTVEKDAEEMDVSLPFPLVQVNDDDEWYDGPDDSDYETDDSNAENNPLNEYPDEESDEEVESTTSTDESEKSEEQETGSEESTTDEDRKRQDVSDDDDMDNDDYDDKLDASPYVDSDDADDGGDWRWAYR